MREEEGGPGRGKVSTPDHSSVSVDSPLYRRMSAVMHVLIFLYASAFWVQVGVLPFLTKKLGASTVVFGYLETVFAIAMVLGGPLFGRFGDLFGSRAALLVAFVSSFMTYTTLALANGIPALFLSRFFGFMMHVMHGAQMVMTDISGTQKRADALGKLGVSYGVGMVVGPTLGGYVTSWSSEQFAAGVAAGMCVVAMVIVLATVPRTTKDPRRASVDFKDHEVHSTGSVFNLQAILSLMRIPAVSYVVVLRTLIGIPMGVLQAMYTVVNMERFNLTPESNGYMLSFSGIVVMVMQGFGVGYISKRTKDATIVRWSLATLALSYLVMVFVDSIVGMVVVLIPMLMSGSLLNTISSSVITKHVPETATGTALGLNMATNSILRAVSPTIGGYLYSWFGFPSFGLFGFVFIGAMTGFVALRGTGPL